MTILRTTHNVRALGASLLSQVDRTSLFYERGQVLTLAHFIAYFLKI